MATIKPATHIHEQLNRERLSSQALSRGFATKSSCGALVISTGRFTGRSPADKFIVRDEITDKAVDWNTFNQALESPQFFRLLDAMTGYLDRLPEVWIRNVTACADLRYRLPIRVITADPQSNHFAADLFYEYSGDAAGEDGGWQLIHAPGFKADPRVHGTNNENFTVVSFRQRMILIGGSAYTGEIKKAVFTVLNLLLPSVHQVLTMHCSANEGKKGVALFFGLSGTGKTTLSADSARQLIGDDEHGWDEHGVFNLEAGCYAKVLGLSEAREPAIYRAIRTGTLVENTPYKPGTAEIDFESAMITENTRASYPLEHLAGSKRPATGPPPADIFFLTCDAYGVLPPIAKLDPEQAVYYFRRGYTARIAGTEDGVREPRAVFSPCFGAPFLPLPIQTYADLFLDKLKKFRPEDVWLINTGWSGGAYGESHRIPLQYARAIINAVTDGHLAGVQYKVSKFRHLMIPVSCPGVPDTLLDPELAWQDSGRYLQAVTRLEALFNAAGSFE